MGFLGARSLSACVHKQWRKHRLSICELFYGRGGINQTPTSASENTFFTAVESTNHKLQYGGLNDPRRMIYTPVTVRSRRPLLRTLPPSSPFPIFFPIPLTLTRSVEANGPRTITANGEHVLALPSDQPFDVETPKIKQNMPQAEAN